MMKLRPCQLLWLCFVLLQCVLPLAHFAHGHTTLSDYHLHPQSIESHCETQSNAVDWQACLRPLRLLSQPVILVATLPVAFILCPISLPLPALLPPFSIRDYAFTWSQAPPIASL